MARSNNPQFIFNYFLLLFIINVILIGLAIYFYRSHFLFWIYPYSYAGMERTFETNLPNTTSMYLYAAAMLLSGLIMLVLANSYRHIKNHKNGYLSLLFLVAGIGFIIAGLSPDDTRHLYHVIGSALFVAMFWIIATTCLYKIRNHLGYRQYLLLQLILQVPVLAYAATYFLNFDIQSTIQKFAFFTLPFVLLYATRFRNETK